MISRARRMSARSNRFNGALKPAVWIGIKRRLRLTSLVIWLSFWTTAAPAFAAPAVFWVSEPANPGDVVLLYGGGLAHVARASIRRFDDVDPGAPSGAVGSARASAPIQALQETDGSLKFIIPPSMAPGVFALDLGGSPVMIDRPRVEWCQPTRLLPGLSQNEAAPGATIQIIGRNFALKTPAPGSARVALKARDGRIVSIKLVSADKYSILAALPQNLAEGDYQVWVHNGFGGPAGWGTGLTLRVKHPGYWPSGTFNIRQFGAHGDDTNDDSEAFLRVLAAAERAGGGIIFFPAGTYRFNRWFRLPRRVVLRGEGEDLTWLKWPQTNPTSLADILPAALYGAGEYAIEDLSIMVRNAQFVLRDLEYGGAVPLPELRRFAQPFGSGRDIFLRNVRIHHLYLAGRNFQAKDVIADPRWRFNAFGYAAQPLVLAMAIGAVTNIEISNCDFQGMQRFLNCRNARFINNSFNNQMGLGSWTDLDGEYFVFQRNKLIGASSWRDDLVPVRYIYCADNYSVNIVRGEREAMTFDVDAGRIGFLGRFRLSAINGGLPVSLPIRAAVAMAAPATVNLAGANLQPGAYRDFQIQIVSGTGAGQYRDIINNTRDRVMLAQPWLITPDATSSVVIHRLIGHAILYRNVAEDTSVLFEIWGQLYDAVIDGNTVRRSQGMYGLGGWFIEWIDNHLEAAVSFHAGVGPIGDTPEHTVPYGLLGFTVGGKMTAAYVRSPFEYVRACVIRENSLSYGYRIMVKVGCSAAFTKVNYVAARDVVIDRNSIDHSPVGIEIDANVAGVVIRGNKVRAVQQPLLLLAPAQCLVLGGR